MRPLSFAAIALWLVTPLAAPLQLNCSENKIRIPKFEYYDAQNNLAFATVNMADQPIDAKVNHWASLLKAVCGVSGTYEGMNDASYKKIGGQGKQKIYIVVEQIGNKITVTFRTSSGSEGKGVGNLNGTSASSILLQSTTPGCSGSYQASLKFDSNTVKWSYKGEDCGGPMEGHGTATKVKL